jgi:hypothetical protein
MGCPPTHPPAPTRAHPCRVPQVWLARVVDAMRAALSSEFKAAAAAYDERPRPRWVFDYSAQNTVVVSRTYFTQEASSAAAAEWGRCRALCRDCALGMHSQDCTCTHTRDCALSPWQSCCCVDRTWLAAPPFCCPARRSTRRSTSCRMETRTPSRHARHITAQRSTAQHSAAQHSIA